MKDTEFQHEYDFDWDRVTSSFWKKYCRKGLWCMTSRASQLRPIACLGFEPRD